MFTEFDPLEAKQSINTEVAINAVKREIVNTLDSYFGWFDPFCELIQNALDSVEERITEETELYEPQIRIIINLQSNTLTVSDNGIGLSKEKFEQFLAPSVSFKSGNNRGHKGVGATYLAYGFNHIQIVTKTKDFGAVGKMEDAHKWLTDENPASNPKVTLDLSGPNDQSFDKFDRGVSITLQFDQSTKPGNLSWIGATNSTQWMKILLIKTGIGSFFPNEGIKVTIEVIDNTGQPTTDQTGIGYLWPHTIVRRSESLQTLQKTQNRMFEKHGLEYKMPSAMTNLDAIYDKFDTTTLKEQIVLDTNEEDICEHYDPTVYFCYAFSTKVWSEFNKNLEIRSGQNILTPGIQIAASNMPQGEVKQVPLLRNIGRQRQIHVVVHLSDCRTDLGRKGFQTDIVEFGQSVARKLIEGPIQKMRRNLRTVTGVRNDLLRESEVDDWKEQFTEHESNNPLNINNDHFFLPTHRISLTSIPTREQDVIALFNQLLAGGVIRGIKIMATNERFTYDGMYRVIKDNPLSNHIYSENSNPLGLLNDYLKDEFVSNPKIMEYKFSLDALIEDVQSGDKNSNDISLVVVWETGSDYKGNYLITSLLDPDNLSERQYHGVTHVMTNVTTGQREMDLIVLKELISFLNDPDRVVKQQKNKYESELLAED